MVFADKSAPINNLIFQMVIDFLIGLSRSKLSCDLCVVIGGGVSDERPSRARLRVPVTPTGILIRLWFLYGLTVELR